MLDANDVMRILRIGRSQAYEIIDRVNTLYRRDERKHGKKSCSVGDFLRYEGRDEEWLTTCLWWDGVASDIESRAAFSDRYGSMRYEFNAPGFDSMPF